MLDFVGLKGTHNLDVGDAAFVLGFCHHRSIIAASARRHRRGKVGGRDSTSARSDAIRLSSNSVENALRVSPVRKDRLPPGLRRERLTPQTPES